MKGWQVGVVAATVIGVLALFTYLFHPTDRGLPPPVAQDPTTGLYHALPVAVPSDQPKKEIQGSSSVFTGHDSAGRISWTLKAASILMRDTVKQADATDIACTFYSKDGQPLATVTCRGASVNLANNNLQFHGRVTATDPAGQTLVVEHLRYDGAKKRFLGHGGVRLTRATSVVLAERVWADPSLMTVQLEGNVQAFVRTLAVSTPSPVPAPTIPPLPAESPAPSGASAAPAALPAGSGAPAAVPTLAPGVGPSPGASSRGNQNRVAASTVLLAARLRPFAEGTVLP